MSLINNPQVFIESESYGAVRKNSSVKFKLDDNNEFEFSFNEKLNTLDCRDKLPKKGYISAELPIPLGNRFKHFSLISRYDSQLRANIASNNYKNADKLVSFLKKVYLHNDFSGLNVTKIGRHEFYFLMKVNGYYLREDHFSSGEYFLIQIYRLVSSGAKLIIIDEIDVALDASAQVNLYSALEEVLKKNDSQMVVISHSLAFMNTAKEGALYYLEKNNDVATLEQRSYGYVKSDLYGFRGKDRYIITEDAVLAGFISYLVKRYMKPFFEYEIIPVGGQPQIEMMALKNDRHKIFGHSDSVIIVVDNDIFNKINYKGSSKLFASPVDDIELFIWENRKSLLSDVVIGKFKEAEKEKKVAKTFWKKIIRSKQKTEDELYSLVCRKNLRNTRRLLLSLKEHLLLPSNK